MGILSDVWAREMVKTVPFLPAALNADGAAVTDHGCRSSWTTPRPIPELLVLKNGIKDANDVFLRYPGSRVLDPDLKKMAYHPSEVATVITSTVRHGVHAR
jgi:hypothetical protein